MATLKQEIESALKVKMVSKGYKKHNHVYLKYISDDIMAFVSMDCSSFSYHNYIDIVPRLGLRYDKVEHIMKDFMWNGGKYLLPTVSSPIGYLMPENTWVEWYYSKEISYNHVSRVGLPRHVFGQHEACVDDICKAIEEYGTPYFERYSKIENLIQFIEDIGIGSANAVLIIRLPILYYIVGRKDLGFKYIAKVRTIDPVNYFSDDYVETYNALV